MYLNLLKDLEENNEALEAQELIKDCVHCGMCLGSCPTYGVLGDELDSPRGRIYQIKNLLEGTADEASVQLHLDRCLTCRSCETACPSGVQYGHILEWGRAHLADKGTRAWHERVQMAGLRQVLSSPNLFNILWQVGQKTKGILPPHYAKKFKPAAKQVSTAAAPKLNEPVQMTVILHQVCVQNTLSPNINHATQRLLEAWGVNVLVAHDTCCGAVAAHTGDLDGSLDKACHNIEAWGSLIARHPHALIISNASACGLQLKEYAFALRHDAQWAPRARRISAAVRDVSELMSTLLESSPSLFEALKTRIAQLPEASKTLAYHEPCTLQHGQKLKNKMATLLTSLGVKLTPSINTHLCCGSAGTYAVTQPEISNQLLKNKINDLKVENAACIISANVGCINHIAIATNKDVIHWIEWFDALWAGEIY